MKNKGVLVIPTFRRKNINALNLLKKYKNLNIVLAVDEIEAICGFYDDIKDKRVSFIYTGSNNIGDKRQEIYDELQDKYEYIIMLDDGISNLVNYGNKRESIFKSINKVIKEFEVNKQIIGINFIGSDYAKIDNNGANNIHSSLAQAFILSTERFNKSGLTFKSCDDVGFEDFVLSYEAMKKGGLIPNSKILFKEGKLGGPTNMLLGGTHELDTIGQAIHKNNLKGMKSYNYLTELYKDADLQFVYIYDNNYKYIKLSGQR